MYISIKINVQNHVSFSLFNLWVGQLFAIIYIYNIILMVLRYSIKVFNTHAQNKKNE